MVSDLSAVGSRIALRLTDLTLTEEHCFTIDLLKPRMLTLSTDCFSEYRSAERLVDDLARLKEDFCAATGNGDFILMAETILGEKLKLPPPLVNVTGIQLERSTARALAMAAAIQLKDLGITMIAAPSADISWSRSAYSMALESYADNADDVTLHACEVFEGIRAAGVQPCAKYFPGLGGANKYLENQLPELHLNLAELMIRDVKPFGALFDFGLKAVLVPVASYPSLDRERPAPLSPAIVDDLLRKKLGFSGLSISEALDFAEMLQVYTVPELAKCASDKACDIFQFNDPEIALQFSKSVLDALRLGLIAESEFCAAQVRIEEFLTASRS